MTTLQKQVIREMESGRLLRIEKMIGHPEHWSIVEPAGAPGQYAIIRKVHWRTAFGLSRRKMLQEIQRVSEGQKVFRLTPQAAKMMNEIQEEQTPADVIENLKDGWKVYVVAGTSRGWVYLVKDAKEPRKLPRRIFTCLLIEEMLEKQPYQVGKYEVYKFIK